MENKDIKIGEEALPGEELQTVPVNDTQSEESVDILSGMPVLAGTDEDTEDNCIADNEPTVEKENKKKQNTALDYLHDLVFGLVAILLVFMLLFRGVVVSGSSMNDTFVDGDYIILLSNVFYTNPKPGDVVVASKDSFHSGEPIIKRVIATEGQKVDIDFEEGIVYVDDVPLDEPYTKTPTNEPIYAYVEFPLIVDEGCVFVMGDNRNDSTDSRSPQIGLIDKREIMGKAIFLIIPGTDKGTEPRDYSRIGVLW